ncbi:MAG: hypothetical protein WC979_01035 [Candidatus Pacearchaeota archaeon]|jgi:hypothetical protein|nr:hypothetical protein [Clostridia bacterium]
MIKYRDEEIQTTWMISLSANRFYRKTDCLYATQDIKFDDNLTPNEITELLFTKATSYRKRVLKAKGWIAKGCGGLEKHYNLNGDMTIVYPKIK